MYSNKLVLLNVFAAIIYFACIQSFIISLCNYFLVNFVYEALLTNTIKQRTLAFCIGSLVRQLNWYFIFVLFSQFLLLSAFFFFMYLQTTCSALLYSKEAHFTDMKVMVVYCPEFFFFFFTVVVVVVVIKFKSMII